MPPRLRILLFRRLLTTAASATTPLPAPSLAAPKPTDPSLLLRLCTVLYQHQNAPDDALNRRLSALPLPTAPADLRELFLQASARFPLSWRPVHRLLAHLSARHGGDGSSNFPHSPATAARLLDVLAKSSNIDLLHSTLHALPRGLLSAAAIRAAMRGLAPAREVGKVAALLTLFPECHRARVLTFVTDVACSTCRLPDVAEKVIKRAEHRHGVARTARCSELLVVAYCRAGALADACRVWNGMGRGGLEPGAAAYQEIVVTMFKNNRVADAMMVFDGMRRSGVPDAGGGCCRAGHLGKRGRKGRDPLVNFESIFVGGLVKAGRTLEANKFVERTMWGGVDVPRFDYNKFLYYFSNEEGVAMFEEVGKRLREVGLIDLGDILSTYGERMATRDRRRTAMNGLLGLVQDVSCQTSSKN
ncbi:hypothetical protein PR202_gb21530 [Eleusine coracana subsp. coracana]|uniref:Pentatricopeptide repeat-containing protein n=1 Tax=Eleusine coracana subsp. coracana TaxID=191504 RepID=A0AAV5FE70_ELECO|nr:hypothetical protein PR202_gb21530 [Eleusine coracana subsp. coracana]